MEDGTGSPAQREWQPPTLRLLGDARTLTMKGNPAGPVDTSGGAGDTSP
jgi:hypothetical protein